MPADPNNKIKAFQITDKLVIWTVYTDLFKKKVYPLITSFMFP